MFATLEKQTAEELLYGSAMPARESDYLGGDNTLTKFNYGHDLNAYEKLVQNKYADTFFPDVTEPVAAATSLYTAAAPAPTLDTYHFAKPVYTAPAEPQMEYYTGDKTIPYKTFRPQIFEYEEPAPVVDNTLEEIATVDVVEEPVQVEMPTYAPEVVPHLRLNSKGIIAVATFAAITVLLAIMLVINTVAISSGNATISQLLADNAATSSTLYDGSNSLTQQRNDAYQFGLNQAQALAGSQGYGIAGQVQLPPIPPAPNLNINSDYSTNIFDQIVKFISSIFG